MPELGSRRDGTGWDNSGRQLVDRRWIYEHDAWGTAVEATASLGTAPP